MTERLEWKILSLATEDYQGLWEIRSEIEQLAGVDQARLPRMLVEALDRLLAQDWVRFYRGALVGGVATPVPREEAGRIVRRPESWLLPDEHGDDLAVAATPAGEQAYFCPKGP